MRRDCSQAPIDFLQAGVKELREQDPGRWLFVLPSGISA